LQDLYELGARKFGIIDVPPLGCAPSQRARNTSTGGCYNQLNDLAKAFHQTIGLALHELHFELPEMKFSLGNAYSIVTNIMANPMPFSK